MPRPPRPQIAGGIYHIIARGVRREKIYCDEADYREFLRLLGKVVKRFGWRCHAYCLMPNHYHLLIETLVPNLSAGMQRLNSAYADWFNIQYGVVGHVFERRFYSVVVTSNWHLMELSRYIVLNPVRAGLCSEAAGWPWSSYRAAVGLAPRASFLTLDWLLMQFGPNLSEARSGYAEFVRSAPPRARGP